MKLSAFSRIIRWLESTELFARPSRAIPGVWQLFEYYTEPSGELIHVKEDELAAGKYFWEITFDAEGSFRQRSNLPVRFISAIESCKWDITGNFILLIHPENFRENVKFQFAVEKQNLKLLKKDTSGRIEMFGFFRKSKDSGA
jgi:hypothetical protein